MKKDLAFGKLNYMILIFGVVIVIIGFFLMSGDGTTEEAFNPEIFSDTRIKVAPMVTLFGFLSVIAAILVKPGKKNCGGEENEVEANDSEIKE